MAANSFQIFVGTLQFTGRQFRLRHDLSAALSLVLVGDLVFRFDWYDGSFVSAEPAGT
jgi:hypothetical protein